MCVSFTRCCHHYSLSRSLISSICTRLWRVCRQHLAASTSSLIDFIHIHLRLLFSCCSSLWFEFISTGWTCVCVCVFVCVYARVSVCLWVFFSGAGKLKSAFAGIDIGNQLTPSSALIPKTQKKTKKLLDRSSSRILNQETLKSWHRQKRWINFSIPTDGRLTVNFSAISER